MNFENAKCKGLSKSRPHPFFEGYELDAKNGEKVIAMKAFCGSCPECQACNEYAIQSESDGFWGGNYYRKGKRIKITARFSTEDQLDTFSRNMLASRVSA